MVNKKYDLKSRFDSRKSFYNKAVVEQDIENNADLLYSYDTLVAKVERGKVFLFPSWDYSLTTLRHVKEFLKQQGFVADTKKQISKDYLAVNTRKIIKKGVKMSEVGCVKENILKAIDECYDLLVLEEIEQAVYSQLKRYKRFRGV